MRHTVKLFDASGNHVGNITSQDVGSWPSVIRGGPRTIKFPKARKPWELKTTEECIVWTMASQALRDRHLTFRAMFNWREYSKEERDSIISMIYICMEIPRGYQLSRIAMNLVHRIPLPWKFPHNEKV